MIESESTCAISGLCANAEEAIMENNINENNFILVLLFGYVFYWIPN
jgi:hypothetical protein